MMKKTRIWAVVLLMLALAPAWSMGNRGKSDTSDGKLNINVTALHWAPHPLPAEESIVFKTIEERQGVKFNFDWRQGTDYAAQVAVLLAGGKLPDLIDPSQYGIMALVREGAIIPLDDVLQKYGQNILAAVGE
jgi:ABC-type glycerol-3-phosphate transport system substrate-binding protein